MYRSLNVHEPQLKDLVLDLVADPIGLPRVGPCLLCAGSGESKVYRGRPCVQCNGIGLSYFAPEVRRAA